MVQAWDFVTAAVLWQKAEPKVRPLIIDTIFNARVLAVCRRMHELAAEFTWWTAPRPRGPLIYVDELTAYSAAELLSIPNFGRRSLRELEGRLAELGMTLRQPEPARHLPTPPRDFDSFRQDFGAHP